MRTFVEPSPFEKKTATPKKSEAEMVGEFMGAKAKREFERKFGKGNQETSQGDALERGLTKSERALAEAVVLERESRRFFKRAEDDAEDVGETNFHYRHALLKLGVESARAGRSPDDFFDEVRRLLAPYSPASHPALHLDLAEDMMAAGKDAAWILRGVKLALIQTAPDWRNRTWGLCRVGKDFLKAGLVQDARECAEAVRLPDDIRNRMDLLRRCVEEDRVRNENPDEDLEAMEKAVDGAVFKEEVRSMYVLALAEIQRFEKAEMVAKLITVPYWKSVTLSRLGEAKVKAGQDPTSVFEEAAVFARIWEVAPFANTMKADALAILAAAKQKAGVNASLELREVDVITSAPNISTKGPVIEYAEAGLLERAEVLAQRLLDTQDNAEAFFVLGEQEAKAGKFAEAKARALNLFEQYGAIGKDLLEIIFRELVRARRFEEARSFIEASEFTKELKGRWLADLGVDLAEAGKSPRDAFEKAKTLIASMEDEDEENDDRNSMLSTRSVLFAHLAASMAIAAKAIRARVGDKK